MASNLPTCHVEGIKLIKASMSPSQMCEFFQDGLAKEVGSDTDLSDLRIVLKAESAHKVEVNVTRVSGDHSADLTPMAVQVLDRPIDSRDIQSLAAAVGHALLNQKR